MITQEHFIEAKGKLSTDGFDGKVSHIVKVTVTGKRDLRRLAKIVSEKGNNQLASDLLKATSFSTTMSTAAAKEIFGGK